MGDSPKKGPQVTRVKLAPAQLVLLCLTLRDTFGSPLVGMKLTVKQGGKELKAPGGRGLLTSDKGRVDVSEVEPVGNLEVALDPDFVPVDGDDRRPSTKYQYTVASVTEIVEYAVTDDPDSKSPVDAKRAFATAFAAPNPFTPVFRFPWQNPLHNAKLDGKDRIYSNRVVNLAFALQKLFNVDKAVAEGLNHTDLVARLVDLFERSKVTAAPNESAVAATSSQTNQGTEHEPERPPPSTPAPIPVEPTPESPLKLTRKIEVKDNTSKPEQPTAPPPKPPPAAPDATADSAALPRWVWYMLFHHSGLRYSPQVLEPAKVGAHGTYIYPGLILKKMRERELETQFRDSGPAPDAADITEALALAERNKKNDAKASILTADPKKQKAGISSLFLAIAEAEQLRLVSFRGPGDILTGDYFALGLLKAKRLKKHTLLTDAAWESVTSCTPLRNDVQKDEWERLPLGEALEPVFFTQPEQEANNKIRVDNSTLPREKRKPTKGLGLDSTQWRNRRQRTLDTILSAAVCDQTSESAELMRGHTLNGGIPANASRCAALQFLTFANARFLRRGMHLFYSGFALAGVDQDYPTTALPWGGAAVFVNRLPDTDRTTRRTATLIADMAVVKLDDIVDANHPLNKAIDKKNVQARAQKPPQQLAPRVIIDPERKFDGVRRMDAASLGNRASGEAFVKCVSEKIPDPDAPRGPPLDVVRLHVMKWTHQEVIIDVSVTPTKVEVRLFSTAGGPDTQGGTGIRIHDLRFKSVDSTMNIVFGFIQATPHENSALLDACYLNPVLLRK